MRHFGCAERMQPQRRIHLLQAAQQLLVEVDAQTRMQPALQQQLVGAQFERTVDLLAILGECGNERPLGLVRLAVEVAEAAARDADIGYVDIAVDLPRDDRLVVDRLAAQHVGRLAELVQRRTVVKHIGLLARQRLALQALFIYWFECVHTQSTISKSNVRRRRSADLTRTLTGVPSVKVRP